MLAQILTIVFLLLLSFFFSGSEAAMLFLSRMRVGRTSSSQVRASKAIEALLSDTKGLLVTLLLGNELVNVALASVVASIIVPRLGEKQGTPVAFILGLGLLLIFGELTPKSLALRYPHDFAIAVVHPLRFFYVLLKPIRKMVQGIANIMLHKSMRGSWDGAQSGFTDDEFESLVEEGLAVGIYRRDEAQMMRRILALRHMTAKELMTPRTEVMAMPVQITVGEAVAALRERYFARIPVFSESIDNVQGVVLAKELIRVADSGGTRTPISQYIREVPVVPETKKANKLLALLVAERAHLAVLIDEYGGTEGIVSMEDILEEIVGEIIDEKDEEVKEITKIGPNTFSVLSTARLDLFAEEIGFALPEGDYDTVGGFVVTKLGRIPAHGEVLREGPIQFEVIKTEKSRIVSMLVRRLAIAPIDGEVSK
ncbi:MAG: HlyC/CorC family transporter [Candidatus Coatesbacteria bacterium]|nr:HlyC/CorC family transporter [Candidatus Coatesbacteria bacterium]